MTVAFPIEDTNAEPFATFRDLVDFIYENAEDLEAVEHFAEQAFGITAHDDQPKLRLAQALLRVAALYDAGGIIESLDERTA